MASQRLPLELGRLLNEILVSPRTVSLQGTHSWLLLAPPGSSWSLLPPPGSWPCAPGSSWLPLAPPGSPWPPLAPPDPS